MALKDLEKWSFGEILYIGFVFFFIVIALLCAAVMSFMPSWHHDALVVIIAGAAIGGIISVARLYGYIPRKMNEEAKKRKY